MDGFELAHAIKSDPRFQAPKLVVLSLDRLTMPGRCGCGRRCLLMKPVKQSALYDSLTRCSDDRIARHHGLAVLLEERDPAQRPLRILVAEDNLVNRKVALTSRSSAILSSWKTPQALTALTARLRRRADGPPDA